MQPEDHLSDRAREELRRSLIDPGNMAARMRYVSEILALIINIEDWRSEHADEHDGSC